MIVEVAPGMDIEWLTDIALKHDAIRPGNLVVERQFGYLEFHAARSGLGPVRGDGDTGSGRRCGGRRPCRRRSWHRASSTGSTPTIPFWSTGTSRAACCCLGDTLFILEMTPSANALLAANEAEKAADVKLGRLPLHGRRGTALHGRHGVEWCAPAAEAATAALGAGGA